MKKENEVITLQGKEIIEVLSEIEYILISLRDTANYYYAHPELSPTQETDIAYALETTRFIDKNRVNDRLNKMRNILSAPFNSEVDENDMDDIERALAKLRYWEKPGD